MPRSFAPPNAGAGSGSPSSSSVNSGQSKRRSTKISPHAMRRQRPRPNRIYPATSGLDQRTCFVAMVQFLNANGYDLAIEDSAAWADTIIALVEHRTTEEDFVQVIRPFVV